MKVTFDLKNCSVCEHSHYIGGYGTTPYKYECKHPRAKRPKDRLTRAQGLHVNFITELNEIADWCPVKAGAKYR